MRIDVDARRVALLARPGLARERLSTVLDEAGALCVLAADPTELDPAALLELEPQVVVVALDPLTEEVLELFDAVLGDPSVDVIYEEAEQAVSREGWDAARWQRHLVAKLQGHANVLPPHRIRSAEALVAMETAPPEAGTLEPAIGSSFEPLHGEIELVAEDAAPGPLPELSPELDAEPAPAIGMELSLASIQGEVSGYDAPGVERDDTPGDFDFSFELARDDRSDGAFDADAQDAGAFDPVNAEVYGDADASTDFGSDLQLVDDAASPPRLELSLLDDAPEVVKQSRGDESTQSRQPFSALELVDDESRPPSQHPRGAVLILSGLGGPDAVRQLLGALPTGFPRPVLVRQHLDGGRYDRLVTQLQRATALPVELAEPGQLALPGTVYILSDLVGASMDDDQGIRFSSDPGQAVLAALASADSAVLLLSGSDPAHVDAAMAHALGGALVAGQSADGCYDSAAPGALSAVGGELASPAGLALRLSARWSNQGSSNVQA